VFIAYHVSEIKHDQRIYIWSKFTGQTNLHRAIEVQEMDKAQHCMIGFRGHPEQDDVEYLERAWIALHHETYAEIMGGEGHHPHRIYKDEHGVFRWEAFPEREQEIMNQFGAKDLNDLFGRCHAEGKHGGKNDPLIRQLYRCMGYSLSGYHEIFYWDWNNEEADKWDSSKVIEPDFY
jgi:hypothetical protein